MRRQSSFGKKNNGIVGGMLSASSSWGDLPQRLTTVCIGVPILWTLWSHHRTRFSFFQGVHAIMCWEWIQLTTTATTTTNPQQQQQQQHHPTQPGDNNKTRWYFFALVSIVLTNIPDDSLFLASLVAATALSFVMDDSHDTTSNHAATFTTGLFLITIPCRTWFLLQTNFHHTVSLLLTVWNADTGALLTGRLVRNLRVSYYYGGGNSTASSSSSSSSNTSGTSFAGQQPEWLRRISPNKSVIGLVGGVVGGTLTFCSLPLFWKCIDKFHLAPSPASLVPAGDVSLIPPFAAQQQNDDNGESITSLLSMSSSFLDAHHAVWIGLSLSVAAILGDLWESSVKRKYGAKDVGRLLPGHGGVLDRFDSSLLAVLLYHYYVEQGIL